VSAGYKGKTTSPGIELGNLDAAIAGADKMIREHPDNNGTYAKLVSLLLLRGRVLGKSADLVRAHELAEGIPAADKESVPSLLLRARGRAAIHHFTDALADLDLAEKKPDARDSSAQIRSIRATIQAAQGRYDDAFAFFDGRARSAPTTANLTDLAVVLGKMGKVKEADAMFLEGELKFRAVSPFGLVDLYFERAMMWERAGDLDTATKVYRAAYDRLPQNVHVALHLAQLVAPSEGVTILEPLAETSDDPDVFAGLGILKNLLEAHSGDASLARAKVLYDEHFTKLPEAYADHAGWFWLNVGADLEKAVKAAKKNLEQRSTIEAWELAFAVATAAKDDELLCRAQREVKKMKYRSPRLTEALGKVEGKITCPADGITPASSASPGVSASARAPASASASSSARAEKKPAPR